jgi:hypothetical protein
MRKLILAIIIALFSSGCDVGIKQMDTTEAGILFRRLPTSLGGGISGKVIRPGEMAVVMPWQQLYRFDTRIKSIEYGAGGDQHDASDYVHTRALDGNEVALAVKIEYSIGDNIEDLTKLVEGVATSDDEVQDIVSVVSRAEIRTHMNQLKTAQFFDNDMKYKKQEEIREAMKARLSKFGINVRSVNLKEHRFERLLQDGTVDRSYQEKVNEVQARHEQTEREKLRKATVAADKEREYNETQAEVNRMIATADGSKEQATLRGDAYFESKKNEAEGILATGSAEVEGIVQQINALSGPGGEAILKLELGKQLMKSDPKFVLMGDAKGAGIDVKKTDTNLLFEQLGLMSAFEQGRTAGSNQQGQAEQQQ